MQTITYSQDDNEQLHRDASLSSKSVFLVEWSLPTHKAAHVTVLKHKYVEDHSSVAKKSSQRRTSNLKRFLRRGLIH